MNKLYCALFVLLATFQAGSVLAENIIPYVTVSASNSDAAMPSGNLVNYSGLSAQATNATHNNASDGSTMWSGKASLLDLKLTFDMQQNYNLKEMFVWNFNRQGQTDKGLKNVKIEYSSDGSTWNSVPAPTNPGYTVDNSYPFQLAKASGTPQLAATNLNDGNNSPLNLKGINARYVRLTISQKAGTGNWGTEKVFGLSEAMFTTDDEVNNALNVFVNPDKVINTCGNMVFGGCHNPSLAHSQTILPLLIDAGFNNVRCDMWIETILPQNISYEDYINNVNDAQNPDTWDFSNLELAVRAKKSGMKVMMIIAYCPAWLSCNGKTNGVPKDMTVYADIVRKIYTRYHKYMDWVEVYNEPGYFLNVENSPYSSLGKALAEIYVTCEKVVREITPDMPMGGTSVVTHGDGGVGGTTNRDFFADKRITKDNFNFYSHHVYGDYGIATTQETVTRVKSQLAKFGYGDLPVYFTEWSPSINSAADSATYRGTKAHTFVGTCLVNWMRDGLTGAQHWNYLQAELEGGAQESGISTDSHGMYVWNSRTKEGRLLPKAYVFKLMSRTLGLGAGENKVTESINGADSYLNVASFVNAAGELSTVIVNDNTMPVTIKINCQTTGIARVEKYTVTYTNRGESAENIDATASSGIVSFTVTIDPMSVTGFRYLK